MEKKCGNCRYIDIDSSTLPCVECSGLKSTSYDLWRKDIDEVEDDRELLRAIFEAQMYMFREVERIKIRLGKEK